MKKTNTSLLLITLCGIIFLYSCRRDISVASNPIHMPSPEVKAWLDGEKTGRSNRDIPNITLLQDNLNYSAQWTEESADNEKLVIIPANESFKKATDINEKIYVGLLLFINKYGSIRNANVFLYTASPGSAGLLRNTLYNIFNTAQPANNGRF